MFKGPPLPKAEDFRGFDARDDVSAILAHCVNYGASDVIFKTGERVLAYVRGNLYYASTKVLTTYEMDRIVVWLSSDSMRLKLAGGESADRSIVTTDPLHRDNLGELLKHRFRVNFHAAEFNGDFGMYITMRHIPAVPPTVEELGIEKGVVEASIPRSGMVVCVGETGSGKTTTFAAFIRRIVELDRSDPRAVRGPVLTWEDPIEFSFGRLNSQNVIVGQHEIDVHTSSFAEGVKRALRRSPRLAVIGEMRDFETIDAALELITTGCPLYTTTHARDVSNVIYRMVMKYPANYQEQAFNAIVPRIHMLMAQKLVIRKDFEETFKSTEEIGAEGAREEKSFDQFEREVQNEHRRGRVCLREWIVFDEELKFDILRAGIMGAESVIRSANITDLRGRSMVTTVMTALRDGMIDRDTATETLLEFGYTKQGMEMRRAA